MQTISNVSAAISKYHSYSFTYVTVQEGNQQIALASVTAGTTETIGEPKQVHIALTDNLTEMAITYVTGTSTEPSVRFD